MAKKTTQQIIEDLIADISALNEETKSEETSKAVVHLNEALYWLKQHEEFNS